MWSTLFKNSKWKTNQTSQTTINDLPVEIFTSILRFLDQNSLNNASLTCKLWKDLIESSCRWSLRICTATQFAKTNFLLTTNRKFRSFRLSDKISRTAEDYIPEERIKNLLKIFRKHGQNILVLDMAVYHFENINQLARILSSLPNVRKITLHRMETMSGNLTRSLPELNKLETLDIYSINCEILKCFLNARIATLKVDLSSCSEHFDAFLRSQNRLHSLVVNLMHSMRDSSALFPNITQDASTTFQLTQLSLSKLEGRHFGNLIKFLAQQSETLKRLRLDFDVPDSVLEFVFDEMLALDTLSLFIPDNKELFERLVIHQGINSLFIINSSTNCAYFTDKFIPNLLAKAPNIRHLILMEGYDDETNVAIAQRCPRLENLTIQHLSNDSFRGVRFHSLKVLEIGALSDKIDWHGFTLSHPLLTDLTIEFIYNKCLNSDDIDRIASNVNLKSLRLGHGFVPDKRFFKTIRNKCPDLKVLDLCTGEPHIRRYLENRNECNVLRIRDCIKETTKYLS